MSLIHPPLPADISFELVNKSEEHARLIMAWCNDPVTLKMSFHQKPKEWPAFYREILEAYFLIPDLPPLFALYRGERIAFLRFKREKDPKSISRKCCNVSINIAPAFRGKKFGKSILAEVKNFARNQNYDSVLAECRSENIASQKAFMKAGFEAIGSIQKKIDTGEFIPVVQLLAKVTPDKIFTEKVFIIAEAGSNWRMGTPARDLRMAKTLIEVAAEAGADAVKFQTYRPESVYVENAGGSDYLSQSGIKENSQDIFRDLAMPYEMLNELSAHCKACKIEFMSTPFSAADFAAVDPFVRAHKIASYEISHLRLLELAAKSGKPLILSTGASREEDIAWALQTFRASGGKDIVLLQCTAKYPAPLDSLNLYVLPYLKKRFDVPVGLSDHSRHPIYAPLAAVTLGARVIEKHYTLDNRLPGPDHSFAILPSELKEMVQAIRAAEKVLGSGIKEILPAEKELSAYARRGIQATQSIAKGTTLREGINIDILRPGKQRLGLHPKHLIDLTGQTAKRDIPLGDGLQLGDWD